MKSVRWKRFLWPLLLMLSALLLAGLVAPFVSAAWFSGRIQRELESSLGRPVEFESAHFMLFSGPGFALKNVTIGEDPRFGLEPFAFVPTLEARLRLDKFLLGQLRFTSFRLVGPSLNLTKAGDGSWNVVQLVSRLSAPRRPVLNLFPTLEVSEGRVDFKLGTRKTVLYMSQSDLAVYPERSGKVQIRFSGSPARTDRAGMGFGYLHGYVDWFASGPRLNQIDARVTLDPSNLSELTTLFSGHDVGVHGTLSSNLRVDGPANALHVSGDLTVNDVHRWDLIPSRGESWTVGYEGAIDLLAHELDVRTVSEQAAPLPPVSVHFRVDQFLTNPACSIIAEMRQAPLAKLTPLASRMGISLPNAGAVEGSVTGALGYSNKAGWKGAFTINDAVASMPGGTLLRAAAADITVAGDNIQLLPTVVASGAGSIRLSASYQFTTGAAKTSLDATSAPVTLLRSTLTAWSGANPNFAMIGNGVATGHFTYLFEGKIPGNADSETMPAWSGQFAFANSSISLPALSAPLRDASGHVSFNDSSFELDRLVATLRDSPVRATYRYSALAKRPEKIKVSMESVDLSALAQMISPALEPNGFLARLRLVPRTVPTWLSARNAEGEFTVHDFAIDGKPFGQLDVRFLWRAAELNFTDIDIGLPEGRIAGNGTLNLASSGPDLHLVGSVSNFGWKGGTIDAEGELDTVGQGEDSLRNLNAKGSFTADDVALSPSATFDRVSGSFALSLADGWPDLHLQDIQALQDQDQWAGEASTDKDGKLLIDLEHAGKQLRIVSNLSSENVSSSSPATDRIALR